MYIQLNSQGMMLVHTHTTGHAALLFLTHTNAHSKLLMNGVQTVQETADGVILLGQQF